MSESDSRMRIDLLHGDVAGATHQNGTFPSRPQALGPSLLGLPGARSVVRDRVEQVGTSHSVPAPPEEVWQAITNPDALRKWLAACHGSPANGRRDFVLDFEDGEFFLCRPTHAHYPRYLEYRWSWLGIGPARRVIWQLEPRGSETQVTVTEEAQNPPNDWRSWHGEGWVGILGQLDAYLRTGMDWRWPWRRMGPYAVVELPLPVFPAWDELFGQAALKYWLFVNRGVFAAGQTLGVVMGDASGPMELAVREVVQPGELQPSFLPHVEFAVKRGGWGTQIGGRIWLEHGGLGGSILQVFLYGWEGLPAGLQLSERKIMTGFWADALRRAVFKCTPQQWATRPMDTTPDGNHPPKAPDVSYKPGAAREPVVSGNGAG